ncbi:hypothetical protein EAH87_15560 [Sphingomonas koreensis]|nr:hypothetical protein EAH87_15560 [Sphingomonas koreensis]
MSDLLEQFNWSITKMDLSKITGLPDEALHILSGMLVLTVAAYLLRRPPWTWQPWLTVFVAETVNEAYDLTQKVFPTDEGNFRASLHDFWLTLVCPTLILLLWPRFVALDHDGGPLAPLRRLWHSREFLIGFGIAIFVGLLGSIYCW